jgi:hypothetical protein
VTSVVGGSSLILAGALLVGSAVLEASAESPRARASLALRQSDPSAPSAMPDQVAMGRPVDPTRMGIVRRTPVLRPAAVPRSVRSAAQLQRVRQQRDIAQARKAVAPPVRIAVPTLDIRRRLIGLRVQPDRSLEVPESYEDVGWWRDGPAPGAEGAAVIVGHVDSTSGPAVFYELSSLERGAPVRVRRADGTSVTFRVDRIESFPKNDFPSRRVYRTTGRPALHLVTCGGNFDYETGHYRDNVVVFAYATGQGKRDQAGRDRAGRDDRDKAGRDKAGRDNRDQAGRDRPDPREQRERQRAHRQAAATPDQPGPTRR